jgi:2-oxoglutarate dehydrogenase E2 component (dihydrolipoamide succinyltransferase)
MRLRSRIWHEEKRDRSALGSSDESDEARISRWIASAGASVKKGQALLEVETDKVNVEVEAPADGTLGELSAKVGDFVKFGAVVAFVEK